MNGEQSEKRIEKRTSSNRPFEHSNKKEKRADGEQKAKIAAQLMCT